MTSVQSPNLIHAASHGDMTAILLLPANVAIKAIDSIISFILLDSRISD